MQNIPMITLQSKVTIGQEVLFRDLGGESVALNLTTGKYYGFDEVATRMWALLTEYGRVEDAYNQLLAEYDVEEDRLREDLLDFVDELVSHQLVQVDAG
jgi:hypothetical protein